MTRRSSPAHRARTGPPGSSPAQTVELVLRIRKQLGDAGLDAGADTIGWHLTHRHHTTLSRATIHRILTRSGGNQRGVGEVSTLARAIPG